MKTKFIALVLGVFTLASCESWNLPAEEPVIIIDEPIVVEPIVMSPPPPMPPVSRREPMIIAEPLVIVEPIIVEEAIIMESVAVPDENAPDEVLTGELDFDAKVEDEASGKDTVVVYYGTNRELITDNNGQPIQSKLPEEIYGELPGPLHYGKALIVIPPRHKRGRLEGQIVGRSTNDKRYVVLKAV